MPYSKDRALEHLVGKLICLKVEGRRDASPGEFEKAIRLMRAGRAGGAIVFRGTVSETPSLITELREAAPGHIYLASDLEFGAATQFEGATPLPSNMAVAASGDPELAFEKGEITAREARALGVDVAFAPCVDVNTNPDNPIIGIRSFGEDPEYVGRLGAISVRGLHAGGAVACAKHFPGHGDTVVDSHVDLPVLECDEKRLRQVELEPFWQAVEAGSGAVMAAHMAVPALTGDESLPVTLSEKACTGLLRGEMNFQGVLFTDAMIMGGIEKHFSADEAALRAVLAGCDVVLYPRDPEAAFLSLLGAVKDGELPLSRVEQAAERVEKMIAWAAVNHPNNPPSEAGKAEHRMRAEYMAGRGLTLVSDPAGVVPLDRKTKTYLVILDVDGADGTGAAIRRKAIRSGLSGAFDRVAAPLVEGDAEHVLTHTARAEVVVVALYSEGKAWKGSSAVPEEMRELLLLLTKQNEKAVVVSFGTPYILSGLPDSTTLFAACGGGELMEEAFVDALIGVYEPTARLPVKI